MKDDELIKSYQDITADGRKMINNVAHKYIKLRLIWLVNRCENAFTEYELTNYHSMDGMRLSGHLEELVTLLSEIEMAFKKSIDRYYEDPNDPRRNMI